MTEKKTNKHVSIHSRHFVGKGDLVMKQGEKGDTAYLIQSGKVRVFVEHDGKEKDLAILETGEIFGEMALVVDERRTASVEALENTNLVIITRPMMIEKLAKSDVTIRALMKMMIERIKGANNAAVNKKDSYEDLSGAVRAVYAGVESTLQGAQKKTLERSVKPQMDAFLKAIDDFHDLYSDN